MLSFLFPEKIQTCTSGIPNSNNEALTFKQKETSFFLLEQGRFPGGRAAGQVNAEEFQDRGSDHFKQQPGHTRLWDPQMFVCLLSLELPVDKYKRGTNIRKPRREFVFPPQLVPFGEVH